MKDIYLRLFDYKTDKAMPVVATVVSTRGSAPQVAGSSALFNDNGLVAGTIGGGAVEKRIQEISAGRFTDRRSGYFHYNLKNDITRKEEPICGGQITILVDAAPARNHDVFRRMKESLSEKEPGILLTLVSDFNEENADIRRFWYTGKHDSGIPESYLRKAGPVIKEMMLTADPDSYCGIDLSEETGEHALLFLEPVFPAQKLIIAGAGHIGRALAHLGKLTGFEVTVIDDRPEYANRENIPDAHNFITQDVVGAIRELPKTPDTFVVIVTRGHKDDADALKECLGSDVAYLGMIGSKNKIIAMREDFIRKGWATPEQWAKLHSPIGIEINSRTVEEIAISIAAELIKVKNTSKEKLKGCPA